MNAFVMDNLDRTKAGLTGVSVFSAFLITPFLFTGMLHTGIFLSAFPNDRTL